MAAALRQGSRHTPECFFSSGLYKVLQERLPAEPEVAEGPSEAQPPVQPPHPRPAPQGHAESHQVLRGQQRRDAPRGRPSGCPGEGLRTSPEPADGPLGNRKGHRLPQTQVRTGPHCVLHRERARDVLTVSGMREPPEGDRAGLAVQSRRVRVCRPPRRGGRSEHARECLRRESHVPRSSDVSTARARKGSERTE